MSTLAELLLVEHQRDALIRDCVALVEKQIDSRGTLRRLTLKAGLSMLNSIRPNALHRATARLLPDFAVALEPLFQRFRLSSDRDFSLFLQKHPDDAVVALIGVTDQRAGQHPNGSVRTVYERFRPTAESEVRSALPGLSKIISAYIG
ncbi:MAG: DUF6918 family protein [Panacagrimonas sp.]